MAGGDEAPTEISRSFQETPLNTFHDGLCMPYLQSNPEHSTSTVLLHNLDIFALHSRCKHWTFQTHKAPTHFCIERTLQMAFLHSFDSWPGSVSCSISAMQDLLKLKSSGSRSIVLHECGTGTAHSVIKCNLFFLTAQRFRLSKDDGKSTFSEMPWPGHPENLKVRPREATERRNDPFRIRITIVTVSPSCVFHGNFNLQLIWAEWRKPLRRHKHTG